MRSHSMHAALALFLVAQTASASQPNIVLIYADDLGYSDLSCTGATAYKTPHLDRIAKEGVRFTDFHVAQAVCSASRTALLTGCYPNRLGILGALGPNSKNGIHERETTIAEVLKPKGYATAIFGKWHLGHHPQFLPTRHGFDEYLGLPYSNDMWPRHPTNKNFPPLPLIDGEKTTATMPDQTQLTTWYTDRAVKFIEKNKNKPFFLYMPHSMPHVPLHVSDKFKGKSGAGLYGDVISEIDWSVGQVLEALERHGLDDTLVIFTSDNGPWLSYGNHGGAAKNLREGKGTTFEGGVRVPFVARWTGKIPAGTVCKEPVMTIDLLPTFAKLAGASLPALAIDGLDISPLLLGTPGAKTPHDALYFYWGRHLQAVRSGAWKMHFPHDYRSLTGTPGKDGTPGGYSNQQQAKALYDLETDPGETKNVAAEKPDIVARLEQLAERMREDLGDTATKQAGKGVRSPGMVE